MTHLEVGLRQHDVNVSSSGAVEGHRHHHSVLCLPPCVLGAHHHCGDTSHGKRDTRGHRVRHYTSRLSTHTCVTTTLMLPLRLFK